MNPRFDMRSASVLQGVACALVPVLSDHPEYREMKRQGFDAVFVPPGDANALACAMSTVLSDLPRYDAMVRGNLAYVTEHEDFERQMSRLLELLLTRAPE
jgi:glycosyltransferase involved in cell wall biosynthesis